MRILTRYLIRAHIGPFLFSLSLLTGLLLVNVVARRFEDLAGKGLPASVIAEVLLLSLPHILALTLPMAVLVAVLYTFTQFAADNEITALKASGVNLVRLLVPVVVCGALLALVMVWFNDRLLPETNHRLKNLLVDIGRKSPTLELKEQVINEIQAGEFQTRYYLQALEIDRVTNRLRDVVIYDLSVPERDRTVYADSGDMAFNEDRTDLYLTLYNAVVHEVKSTERSAFRRDYFDRHVIRIPGVGDQLERTLDETYRSDREMSLRMLAAEVETRRAELREVIEQMRTAASEAATRVLAGPGGPVAARSVRSADPNGPQEVVESSGTALAGLPGIRPGQATDDLTRRTSFEMRTLRGRADMLNQQINSFLVEYHKKFSIPFACIVFVLLGAPLAVRFPRGGVGLVVAASLVIFTIYYMGLIGGESLGDKGLADPFLVMWAPNFIFLGLAAIGLYNLGRMEATTRGGGWDDLFDTLRSALTAPFRRIRRTREAG
ncbi:MAG TPA: LptF/LptG family permease [Longimicrobiales bacterium]|nr:LptF/LptG family permease [Longimicrobiales bacterium]